MAAYLNIFTVVTSSLFGFFCLTYLLLSPRWAPTMSALPWSSRELEIRTVFRQNLAPCNLFLLFAKTGRFTRIWLEKKNSLSTGVTSLEDGLVLKSPGGETAW